MNSSTCLPASTKQYPIDLADDRSIVELPTENLFVRIQEGNLYAQIEAKCELIRRFYLAYHGDIFTATQLREYPTTLQTAYSKADGASPQWKIYIKEFFGTEQLQIFPDTFLLEKTKEFWNNFEKRLSQHKNLLPQITSVKDLISQVADIENNLHRAQLLTKFNGLRREAINKGNKKFFLAPYTDKSESIKAIIIYLIGDANGLRKNDISLISPKVLKDACDGDLKKLLEQMKILKDIQQAARLNQIWQKTSKRDKAYLG